MGLESALFTGDGTGPTEPNYSRRKILTVGAAMLGLLATPNISFGESSVIQRKNSFDEVLCLFEESCLKEKEKRTPELMRLLGERGLNNKARITTGFYHDPKGERKEASWVEYQFEEVLFALNPEWGVIQPYFTKKIKSKAGRENRPFYLRTQDEDLETYYEFSSSERNPNDLEKAAKENPFIGGENLFRTLVELYRIDYLRDWEESDKKRVLSEKNGDYWQKPEETTLLKVGDCEDLTFLALSRLSKEGFSPYWSLGKVNKGRGEMHAYAKLFPSRFPNSEYLFESITSELFRRKDFGEEVYTEEWESFSDKEKDEFVRDINAYANSLGDEEKKLILDEKNKIIKQIRERENGRK